MSGAHDAAPPPPDTALYLTDTAMHHPITDRHLSVTPPQSISDPQGSHDAAKRLPPAHQDEDARRRVDVDETHEHRDKRVHLLEVAAYADGDNAAESTLAVATSKSMDGGVRRLSALELLPVELVLEIGSYLVREVKHPHGKIDRFQDIAGLRATSRTLHSKTDSMVEKCFTQVYVNFEERCGSKLLRLSSLSNISRHVRMLTFESFKKEPMLSDDDYVRDVRREATAMLSVNSELIHSRLPANIVLLAAAMQQFPRLHAVSTHSSADWSRWASLFYDSNKHIPAAVLHAIFLSGISLHIINMKYPRAFRGVKSEDFDVSTPNHEQFSNLTTLCLLLRVNARYEADEGDRHNGDSKRDLTYVLRTAKCIKHLNLMADEGSTMRLTDGDRDFHGGTKWLHALYQAELPNLKHLNLSGWILNEKKLSAFLTLRKDVLDFILIRHCEFAGSCAKVLEVLLDSTSMHYLKLKYICESGPGRPCTRIGFPITGDAVSRVPRNRFAKFNPIPERGVVCILPTHKWSERLEMVIRDLKVTNVPVNDSGSSSLSWD